MKNFRPANLSQTIAVVALVVGTFFLSACPPFFGGGQSTEDQQGRGFRVWIRTEPCAGRFDWLSVAKEPGGAGTGRGMNSYVPYDSVLGNQGCTLSGSSGCTFAEATALMERLRGDDRFFNYCCREYSVWENTQTGKMSVVQGKFGTAGYGWRFVKGDLCCEEAEELAGIPGACSGSTGGGKTGYIGCYKDTSDFDLNGFLERSRSNTPQRCIETCRAKGFAFAAVQYGESCLCGNSYGKYGAADNCNYKCTGDSSQICGGYNANIVYGTGLSVAGGGGIRKPGGGVIKDDGGIVDGGDDGGVVTPYPTPRINRTPPAVSGRWTLVSVTAIPETPPQGYSYNAQSSSASLLVYNGDKHNFQWAKPPQQIDQDGFTVSFSAQCQSQPRNRCASLIGVAGDGLESDTPSGERKAEAYGENGALGSGQKSVYFRPSPNSDELEVRVELMWGAAKFIYKYQRAQ